MAKSLCNICRSSCISHDYFHNDCVECKKRFLTVKPKSEYDLQFTAGGRVFKLAEQWDNNINYVCAPCCEKAFTQYKQRVAENLQNQEQKNNQQQGYKNFQELEKELKREVRNNGGRFVYRTKLMSADKCNSCQETEELDRQIREKKQQHQEIIRQIEQGNFTDPEPSESENNQENNNDNYEDWQRKDHHKINNQEQVDEREVISLKNMPGYNQSYQGLVENLLKLNREQQERRNSHSNFSGPTSPTNIAKDLPENPTSLQKAKYELCQKILGYQEDNNLSEELLAKKLGLSKEQTLQILFGVGKSTLARAVAAETTKQKIKTLLADCDPQQST
ncbi:14277_t:CDS:2, partial [Racocetra fulgida]